MNNQTKVTGVILAGGLARRMHNQDKGLINFNGRPLVSYAIDALQGLNVPLIINANRNLERYQQFGYPVVADHNDSFDGPLAGILSAMFYAEEGALLVLPCDTPLVTTCHLQKMLSALAESSADIAVAFDGERLHPVFLALKAALKDHLSDYLATGQSKVDRWIEQQNRVCVDFSKESEIFININSLAELAALEEKYKKEYLRD